MTESQTPNHRRTAGLQGKALAGLVAIMIAAAIVALVFVANGGGGNGSNKQAGQSDVANMSTTSSSPSTSAPTTTAPSTKVAPSAKAAPSTRTEPYSSPVADPSSSSKTSSSSHSADAKKVVYTVKKGDTLSDIGKWYSDHGYLKLYNWNKSVIGENPDLIFPGQKIIVVENHVGVARKAPTH